MPLSLQAFCARVYCAVLDEAQIDPVTGVVTLTGHLSDHDRSRPISVRLDGVSRVVWRGRPKDPDGFFELSTVFVRRTDTGWTLRFEPWDTARLEFDCEQLSLNGEPVTGSGTWHQDSIEGPQEL